MRMRKILYAAILLSGLIQTAQAQKIAVKTNTLYWAALAPNIGTELKLSARTTLDLAGAYKPWTVRESCYWRFWLVQPEVRYWLKEPFIGHFFGVHIHGAQYYLLKDGTIYDGGLAGGGITYGYSWALASHWNMEAVIGAGYARLWYVERPDLPCKKCGTDKTKNYVGPTKIALAISYLF